MKLRKEISKKYKMTNIKLILFDLDGVLVDTKKIHFQTLNQAIEEIGGREFIIEWEEHLRLYDGLKTLQKLELLTKHKKLPSDFHHHIWIKKQQLTLKELRSIQPGSIIQDVMSRLTNDGYRLGCCTNSIRKTVNTVLSKLDIIEYFDVIVSNEDVSKSKPYPEIYWKAMTQEGCLPEDTIILEDSPYGLLAAHRTKAHIMRISHLDDVSYNNIKSRIGEIENRGQMRKDVPKWTNHRMNVLIPMAGAGSRFEKAGYTFPKPLIDVNGKPMIQVVVENLNLDANFIYVVQKSHREKYNLDALLSLITPRCNIIEVDGLTEGAACTALLAREFIDNDDALFFANSDQFVEWNPNEFMYKMQESDKDGGIAVFHSTHPKWSFAKINEQGHVTEVAEKYPISDLATVGYYYWKKGSDFVKYADEMISKNIRVNNEFYVCPVFNQAIQDGKELIIYEVDKMWGLGTPEDLTYFVDHYKVAQKTFD